MIKISSPHIEEKNGWAYMISHVLDTVQNIDEDIYYSVKQEYGKYLAYEVSDAFVVGCLLPAALYGEDIVVEGVMSEKLHYNLSHTISYLLANIFKKEKIKIHVNNLTCKSYGAAGVGCGCSLGVDSFSAMLQHIENVSSDKRYTNRLMNKSYAISHLTYFNVGAMGYMDLAKAKESYEKDLKMVQEFAKEVDLPVLCLESNFSILYKDFDFDASGDIRNFSAVLALQKLFGKYLYGSGYPVTNFKFDKNQTGYYEFLLAPLISTESTEIVIADPDMTRIEKTKFIADNHLAQKYLYVCWKELIANRWPNGEIARIKDDHLNCSRCDKCKRTLLAIDLLGKLDKFEAIFDIPYWKKVKDSYIAKVISNKDDNAFYKDLVFLMKEVGYTPSDGVKKELRKIKIRKSIPYRVVAKIKRVIIH